MASDSNIGSAAGMGSRVTFSWRRKAVITCRNGGPARSLYSVSFDKSCFDMWSETSPESPLAFIACQVDGENDILERECTGVETKVNFTDLER